MPDLHGVPHSEPEGVRKGQCGLRVGLERGHVVDIGWRACQLPHLWTSTEDCNPSSATTERVLAWRTASADMNRRPSSGVCCAAGVLLSTAVAILFHDPLRGRTADTTVGRHAFTARSADASTRATRATVRGFRSISPRKRKRPKAVFSASQK